MGEIVSKISSLYDKPKKFTRIPQQLINEANLRISLVDLIGQTVTLSQASKDQWKGLCPLHSEKTPSFFVNETKGFFHCFGCGESGNAVSFLMKVQGMNFPQAAMRILQLAGLEFYDTEQWIQGESAILMESVNKTVQGKTGPDDYEDGSFGSINEALFHISEVCHGVVEMKPFLFDKMEEFYLTVDDNYRFKNYSRIYDICHNLIKILKEIENDSRK